MTTSLVAKVKSRLFIVAHRRARTMLDGEYGSVFRGRSLDFDDLRAYTAGDEVRDIDWKASARHGAPLVKRYAAVRRQTVLLVTDTGRNMAASARGGEPKKDIAIMALGVLGYLAHRHGDRVALVAGDAATSSSLPARAGEAHLELLLRSVDDAVGPEAGPSDLTAQLAHVARTVPQRTLLVVVADEAVVDDEDEALLRRLAAQHEILWLTVRDAALAGPGAPRRSYDVGDGAVLLNLLADAEEVLADYRRLVDERTARREAVLTRLGIVEGHADSVDGVVPAVFRLLERHRRGR
jgi:uncharacterized protein (DUF58 family)